MAALTKQKKEKTFENNWITNVIYLHACGRSDKRKTSKNIWTQLGYKCHLCRVVIENIDHIFNDFLAKKYFFFQRGNECLWCTAVWETWTSSKSKKDNCLAARNSKLSFCPTRWPRRDLWSHTMFWIYSNYMNILSIWFAPQAIASWPREGRMAHDRWSPEADV